jgi:hypothetical protein
VSRECDRLYRVDTGEGGNGTVVKLGDGVFTDRMSLIG